MNDSKTKIKSLAIIILAILALFFGLIFLPVVILLMFINPFSVVNDVAKDDTVATTDDSKLDKEISDKADAYKAEDQYQMMADLTKEAMRNAYEKSLTTIQKAIEAGTKKYTGYSGGTYDPQVGGNPNADTFDKEGSEKATVDYSNGGTITTSIAYLISAYTVSQANVPPQKDNFFFSTQKGWFAGYKSILNKNLIQYKTFPESHTESATGKQRSVPTVIRTTTTDPKTNKTKTVTSVKNVNYAYQEHKINGKIGAFDLEPIMIQFFVYGDSTKWSRNKYYADIMGNGSNEEKLQKILNSNYYEWYMKYQMSCGDYTNQPYCPKHPNAKVVKAHNWSFSAIPLIGRLFNAAHIQENFSYPKYVYRKADHPDYLLMSKEDQDKYNLLYLTGDTGEFSNGSTDEGSSSTSAMDGQWKWPTPSCGTITSPYGPRGSEFHKGIDIGASYGANVDAATDGTVIFAGSGIPNEGFGNCVVIAYNGMAIRYAHLSNITTSVGAHVKAGQLIGHIGSTGRSTGPHLHFEIRTRVENYATAGTVNPMKYFSTKSSASIKRVSALNSVQEIASSSETSSNEQSQKNTKNQELSNTTSLTSSQSSSSVSSQNSQSSSSVSSQNSQSFSSVNSQNSQSSSSVNSQLNSSKKDTAAPNYKDKNLINHTIKVSEKIAFFQYDALKSIDNAMSNEPDGVAESMFGNGESTEAVNVNENEKAVSLAQSAIGKGYSAFTNKITPWGSLFMDWVMKQAGVGSSIYPYGKSILGILEFYQHKNLYKSKASGYKPVIGDLVIFKNSEGEICLGIVSSSNSNLNNITAIAADADTSNHSQSTVQQYSGVKFAENIQGFCTVKYDTASWSKYNITSQLAFDLFAADCAQEGGTSYDGAWWVASVMLNRYDVYFSKSVPFILTPYSANNSSGRNGFNSFLYGFSSAFNRRELGNFDKYRTDIGGSYPSAVKKAVQDALNGKRSCKYTNFATAGSSLDHGGTYHNGNVYTYGL